MMKMMKVTKSLNRPLLIALFAVSGCPALAAPKANLTCTFDGGHYEVDALYSATKLALVEIRDQSNRDPFGPDDLWNPEERSIAGDGRVKLSFECGSENWQHNYYVYLPARPKPGRMAASLAYKYLDEYGKSDSDYVQGSCTLE
jgi:hypothetical protein